MGSSSVTRDRTQSLCIAGRGRVGGALPRWFGSEESTSQCRSYKSHGFDPWVRKIPWRGNDNPLQYSCLGNPMDIEAWRATVHGVANSQMRLSEHTCISLHWEHRALTFGPRGKSKYLILHTQSLLREVHS